MKSLSVSLVLLCIFTLSAHAMECANAGAAPLVPPDDTNDKEATACGDTAYASGDDSAAYGHLATSQGYRSTAVGYGTYAAGIRAIAIGEAASAVGDQSISVGYNSSASHYSGVALGHQATASGLNVLSLGTTANTSGDGSIAMGSDASAAGVNSMALGKQATVAASHSIAMGYQAHTSQHSTIVIGSVPGSGNGLQYMAVGMGTSNPQASLHVARNNGTAQIFVQETSATGAARTLFKLSNKGNTKFEIDETGTGNSWAFTNSGSDFRISRQGSGVVEFTVFNNGNATLAGALTQNSDVHAKQDIVAVDPEEVLEKVSALPVSTWAYRDAPDARHLGPMAQDFHAAFGLGESDTGISSIDTGGVALAAIQALATRNRELAAHQAELEGRMVTENAVLRQRIAELEAVITRLSEMPGFAQN